MLLQGLFALAAVLPSVYACPGHDNYARMPYGKRQTQPAADWTYEASYNWHTVNPAYALCQTGTQQSPIALSLSNGLSLSDAPVFRYPANVSGTFYNWNYGPAFTVAHGGDWTTHPSFQYNNATFYLKGWHTHAPAEHVVNGDRTKAEMHFVHVDAKGHEAAVLAFRLDPGRSNSTFFNQFPSLIGFNEVGVQQHRSIDLTPALASVSYFEQFWTYQGSLTSPPCTEGIRWFVASQVMYTGVEQMRSILAASSYSARVEQEVWQHRINQ